MLFLAVLGLRSGGLHSPGVVMGNLGGGFALLGVLGWICSASRRRRLLRDPAPGADHRLRAFSAVAIAVLAGQILLGGLTSANFAATACTTLPDCHGLWLPGGELTTAFDSAASIRSTPTAAWSVAASGSRSTWPIAGAPCDAARGARLRGARLARRRAQRPFALALNVLVGAEVAVGAAATLTGLPIALAVTHNALAGLLLLTLLRLRASLDAPAVRA